VKRKAYVPERGDAVWISFDPQAGNEQAGRRPALVLSPAAYNRRVGLGSSARSPITRKVIPSKCLSRLESLSRGWWARTW
jgi:mRNA interferase MazF